jgi:hypothetical protein
MSEKPVYIWVDFSLSKISDVICKGSDHYPTPNFSSILFAVVTGRFCGNGQKFQEKLMKSDGIRHGGRTRFGRICWDYGISEPH